MKSSLEIAQEAELIPIDSIAEQAGLLPEEVDPYGRYKAKISLGALDRLKDNPDGKLVCVAGVTPTKAGEGKTTTAVSLTEGLGHIGRKPLLCLREPSLGPVFGIKGGAASRLLAAPIAWMSPVKWRFRSSIGTTCARPAPAPRSRSRSSC